MGATVGTVYLEGLDFFTRAVGRLRSGDWDRPSPCQGWQARDVLGHVGQAVRFGTALLQGGHPEWSPADPPGAAVGPDPVAWWRAIAGPAREAVRDADLSQMVSTPAGQRMVAEGLRFPAIDLYVHAWDLVRVTGATLEIPAGVIEFAHAVLDPMPAGQLRSPRVFGPEMEPPPGATASDCFIAWTGRDPRWAA
jgi:uncharacterized protein (TIGR03086 family)